MAPRYRSAPEMGSGRTGHHDPPTPGLTATGRALLMGCRSAALLLRDGPGLVRLA